MFADCGVRPVGERGYRQGKATLLPGDSWVFFHPQALRGHVSTVSRLTLPLGSDTPANQCLAL